MFSKVGFNILNKADRTTVYVLNMYDQVNHIYMLHLLFPQAVYIMPWTTTRRPSSTCGRASQSPSSWGVWRTRRRSATGWASRCGATGATRNANTCCTRPPNCLRVSDGMRSSTATISCHCSIFRLHATRLYRWKWTLCVLILKKCTLKYWFWYKTENTVFRKKVHVIDLSTARPKWRLDGPALSGHLLYLLVNHACTNPYHHHLVR